MDLNQNSQMNFKGISNPYINKAGYKVIPIAQNPEQKDINEAIFATQNSKAHCGLNGRAYFLGEDLVVKKYKPDAEAVRAYDGREEKALDTLFEKGFVDNSIQKGLYGFKNKETGEKYLVSTRIQGAKPNSITNKLNSKNLKKLVELITKLDTPIKTAEIDKSNFPFEIPMHYDLAEGNINITENNAGIFDFEYLDFVDLDELHQKRNNDTGYYYTSPNISDIPGLVSNLANFEHRCFMKNLKKLDKQEAKELFINYLDMKSDYYNNIASTLTEENAQADFINQPIVDYTEKYKNHAKILKNAYKNPEKYSDIIKAEAIKIESARLEFDCFFNSCKKAINYKEAKEFINNGCEFFKTKYEEAKENNNTDEMNYWEDNMKLLSVRKEGNFSYVPIEPEPLSPSQASDSFYKGWYNDRLKMYEKLRPKENDEHLVTLDMIVCD